MVGETMVKETPRPEGWMTLGAVRVRGAEIVFSQRLFSDHAQFFHLSTRGRV